MDAKEILEKYSQALDLYKAKNFDAALNLLDDIKKAVPAWKKPFMVEAYVRREQHEFLKEFYMLQELLPHFDCTDNDEKLLAADAMSLFGSVCRELGMTEEAVKSFKFSAMLEDDGAKSCVEISNALFAANSSENFSAADFRDLYAEYKKYSVDISPYPRKFYSHEKIRVGFLSSDFQLHAVMSWSWTILNDLDRNFFKVYYYSNVNEENSVTKHFRTKTDGWRDISDLTDEQAAKLIRDDEIDILFDLSGHTSGNRLRVAAYRPASVQISGLGYMNSTGLDCIDYFLSDVYCAGDAAAMSEYFTEKIIKLPHSHFCYSSPVKLDFAPNPPCLKNNFVTFGSFNNFSKVRDFILIAWKKILDAVPNSRLILKHKIFGTDDGKNFVGKRLENFGFDLSRIEMRGYTNAWLTEYADVDIALDTFPYTGGVTTCEALWMGVPVVSIYGKHHGTRFGFSILNNVGFSEFAVDSLGKYCNLAVALAHDWNLLAVLRKNLRGVIEKSPLMDSRNYLRAVEEVFIKILRDEKNRA